MFEEDKKTVEHILQNTWESADDWFQPIMRI
ncbi:DinI-like family protein [Yersinia sp. 2544 StPb PI]